MRKNRFFFALLSILFLSCCTKSTTETVPSDYAYWQTIAAIAVDAEEYARSQGLSQKHCILVDYGLPSGKERVYVWSFEEKKIVLKTHTMHGSGGGSTDETPVFSNQLGSNCSTLGHFAVTRTHGTINPGGYRLKGLDPENRNAWDRALMIHDSFWVDMYCDEPYIPLNEVMCQGCVTVNTEGMREIAKLIDADPQLLLLQSFVIHQEEVDDVK